LFLDLLAAAPIATSLLLSTFRLLRCDEQQSNSSNDAGDTKFTERADLDSKTRLALQFSARIVTVMSDCNSHSDLRSYLLKRLERGGLRESLLDKTKSASCAHAIDGLRAVALRSSHTCGAMQVPTSA
jgi:hypothetical protein